MKHKNVTRELYEQYKCTARTPEKYTCIDLPNYFQGEMKKNSCHAFHMGLFMHRKFEQEIFVELENPPIP